MPKDLPQSLRIPGTQARVRETANYCAGAIHVEGRPSK